VTSWSSWSALTGCQHTPAAVTVLACRVVEADEWPHREYAGMLSAFETIDRGRAVLADEGSPQEARREAADMVWAGNLALLEQFGRTTFSITDDHTSSTGLVTAAWVNPYRPVLPDFPKSGGFFQERFSYQR